VLQLLYFAWIRERIGQDGEQITAPPSGTTVTELLDRLSEQNPVHAAAFADRGRLRAALDQSFVSLDAQIGNSRELALFPPVTGG
jgi:molybdopterin synthase sulfur carrier subunit